MESGPAVLWDDSTYAELQATPLLSDTFYQLTIDELDPVDAQLAATYDQAGTALNELTGTTFELNKQIDPVAEWFNTDEGQSPAPLPADIAQGVTDTDGALDDAVNMVPKIVEEDTPPGSGIPVPPPPDLPNQPPIEGGPQV